MTYKHVMKKYYKLLQAAMQIKLPEIHHITIF